MPACVVTIIFFYLMLLLLIMAQPWHKYFTQEALEEYVNSEQFEKTLEITLESHDGSEMPTLT